jgi:pimeloyl-ACP methyl ester carboxylesterase
MKRVLPLLTLLLLAGPALAAPVLDRVEVEVRKGRRLTVTVEAAFSSPGEIRLEGFVNDRSVAAVKRVRKSGPRRLRLRVDAGKLGYRRVAEPLRFRLTLRALDDSGTTERAVERTVPLPLILLPGLGNEVSPSSVDGLALAVALAAGGDYRAAGKRPNLLVHGYPSVSKPLDALGRGLARAIRRALKGTPFTKVDLVGYSMGGLVSRSAMMEGAEERVRRLVFLGSPNEGTPIAYLGAVAAQFGVSGDVPGLDPALAALLLDEDAGAALANFYPTYPWYPPEQEALLLLLPSRETPLTALNAAGPVAGTDYHAISYSSPGTVETVDFVTALPLLGGGGLTGDDLSGLLQTFGNGTGDGVVPRRSVFLADEPAWAAVVETHDLGPGTHAGLPADPRVVATIVTILEGDD